MQSARMKRLISARLIAPVFAALLTFLPHNAAAGEWEVSIKQVGDLNIFFSSATYVSDKWLPGERASASLLMLAVQPAMLMERPPTAAAGRTVFFERYADEFDKQIRFYDNINDILHTYCGQGGRGDTRAEFGECLYTLGREQSYLYVDLRLRPNSLSAGRWVRADTVMHNIKDNENYYAYGLNRQTPYTPFFKRSYKAEQYLARQKTHCYTDNRVARGAKFDADATCPPAGGGTVTGADGSFKISLALLDKYDAFFQGFAIRFVSDQDVGSAVYVPRLDVLEKLIDSTFANGH